MLVDKSLSSCSSRDSFGRIQAFSHVRNNYMELGIALASFDQPSSSISFSLLAMLVISPSATTMQFLALFHTLLFHEVPWMSISIWIQM